MARRMLTIAAILLGALLLLVVALRWLEPYLIYFPTGAVQHTPAVLGLEFQAVEIATADGETLQAWWLPAPEAPAQMPALLFFHGNAGSREHRLDNLRGLHRAGIPVLIFDYRGYGGSTGKPGEAGLYRDGAAAHAWLRGEAGGRPIAFFGRSLGAAVAAQVALQAGADARPAGLILESPFTSARDMASRVLPLPGVRHLAQARFEVEGAVRELRMPLLVIHGERDEIVPFHMGRAVYEAGAAPRKTFHAVPGGHHNDTYLVAGRAYWDWLRDFLLSLE